MTGDAAVQAMLDGLNRIGIPFMVVGSLSTNVYGDYIHHWCDLHGSREHLDAIRQSLMPK